MIRDQVLSEWANLQAKLTKQQRFLKIIAVVKPY
ncbi:MAG: hypothetical protein GBAus27B_000303 [Mycoplasmataceae bacterium]|nr:MAG: hypothetical protein GBAus27B_000303 [Mycoplasmataceae bacterium]